MTPAANDQTLIESWNGTAWSLVPSPDNGTIPNDLTGVACISSSSCQAVGFSGLGSAEDQTLIESWQMETLGLSCPVPTADRAGLSTRTPC